MDNITIYLPFTKADSDQKIVEGYASTETVDSQGEIIKTEAIGKALPDYMKFANIREMHQWSAVGKTIHAKIDDKKKGLWIRGKIVDKEAWEKVKEKVYNGFSIGGKVLKKIGNIVHELSLNEISLVDRPANPEAVFSLVKFDKGGEMIEKQLPIPPYGMSMADETYLGIKTADKLIAMAASLTLLLNECDHMRRPKKHVEKALSALKNAALFELESEKMAIEKRIKMNQENKQKGIAEVKESLTKLIGSKYYSYHTDYFEGLRKVL